MQGSYQYENFSNIKPKKRVSHYNTECWEGGRELTLECLGTQMTSEVENQQLSSIGYETWTCASP